MRSASTFLIEGTKPQDNPQSNIRIYVKEYTFLLLILLTSFLITNCTSTTTNLNNITSVHKGNKLTQKVTKRTDYNQHGQIVMLIKWYTNSKPKYSCTHAKNGNKATEYFYNRKGKIRRKKTYYISGELYFDFKVHEETKVYEFDNGDTTIATKLSGKGAFYYTSGQIKEKGTIINSTKVGTWISYDSLTQVKSEIKY